MIQLNMQPIEKKEYRLDGALDIMSVFLTIQGEGPYTGMPAVFVRTAGCNLLCPECDTDYTSGRRMASPESLIKQIEQLRPQGGLVVITGGEPFRQNLAPFVLSLLDRYMVQIETNGTYYDIRFPYTAVDIVCSPKTPKINDLLWKHIEAVKYVVEADHVDPADGLPIRVLGADCHAARPPQDWQGEIYVQPADEKDSQQNWRNIQQAVDSCLKFGYRLSLQTHKILGLD